MKVRLTGPQRKVISMIINDYLYTGYHYVPVSLKTLRCLEKKGLIKLFTDRFAEPTEKLKISLLKHDVDLYEMTDIRILSHLRIHEEHEEVRIEYWSEVNKGGKKSGKSLKLLKTLEEVFENDCVEPIFYEKYFGESQHNDLPVQKNKIPKVLEI